MFQQVLDSVGVDGSQMSQLSSTGSQVSTITGPLSFHNVAETSMLILHMQVMVEVHAPGGSSGVQSGYEALCLEILGLHCISV